MFNRKSKIELESDSEQVLFFTTVQMPAWDNIEVVNCENLSEINWQKENLCTHITIYKLPDKDALVLINNKKSFGNPKLIFVYNDYEDKHIFAHEGITSVSISKLGDFCLQNSTERHQDDDQNSDSTIEGLSDE